MTAESAEATATEAAATGTSAAMRATHRVRASELAGRAWLNTGGKELDLAALPGKF